jgi:hypothetical protein
MTEKIGKIHREVEMPQLKRTAFLNLVKTCNGVATKEGGNIYMSKESLLLDSDIRGEKDRCNQLDSGLTDAIMLFYGYSGLERGLGNIDDYASYDILNPKDQYIISTIHSTLNEDKINEAVSLVEDFIATEDIPGVKGLLTKGIEDVRRHLQAFRPVWQKYIDQAQPLVKRSLVGRTKRGDEEERISRSDIQGRLTSNENILEVLTEEMIRKQEELRRLGKRIKGIKKENLELADVLSGTKQKVKKVVQGVVEVPSAKEPLVADLASGMDLKEEAGNMTPFRKVKKANAGEQPTDNV